MHMIGKALQWHMNYLAEQFGIFPSWTNYIIALSGRFNGLFDDPLADLVALKQGTDSVPEYLEKFENARTRLSLPEAHALSIFLTNMNPHLSLHVRQFGSTSLSDAARIASLHESSLAATPQRSYRAPFNPSQQQKNYGAPYKQQTPLLPAPELPKHTTKPTFIPKSNTDRPARKFSYQEMQDRRAKGLCMFCDEAFTPGHQLKHKRSQIFVMECEDEDDDEDPLLENEKITDLTDEEAQAEPTSVISVNALSGSTTFNCMRVIGKYGKRKLYIPVDPGSTHKFLDIKVAHELGCKLDASNPMSVAAANGNNMITKYKCNNFTWSVQGYSFTTEIRTLPLDCCELVLGVQWLSTLGPILWDFLNLIMEFNLNGLKHVLRGVTKSGCKLIKGASLNNLMLQQPQIALLQIREVDTSETTSPLVPESLFSHISAPKSELSDDPLLQSLISSYSDLFEEPMNLPPFREGFDHTIPLKADANPVNLRPYRYSSLQKDAIDELLKDMLQQGIIQCSNSPYASPIVLVKKKDGGWRLCVDYRGLNTQTVKDKYPIPLLEDLLDELGGAVYFSKLDLRAGFHQLRMSPNDVYKTAFKSHAGHYEYLVMPFGLSNAPCTFQSLMNHVFKDISRKFLLVFFDDILVYSPDWETHMIHLQEVFSILRQQQLYLKASKCTFGATKIEYLGHFIEAKGVNTDPAKVDAIKRWPTPNSIKQLRSFLGLANYYRRFIRGYNILSRPLTTLLQKGGFIWSPEADTALDNLKDALSSALVLALPDFNKTFVVETDACNTGIGAVLMQEGHPICYISRALGPRQQALSVYEKELMAVVFAVQTWSAYLAHRPFIIKTDQKSLKYMMEQKATTPFQHMWLSKLMGYDFEVQYKLGKENVAADALSRVSGSQLLHISLPQAHQGFFDSLKLLWQTDPHLSKLIMELKTNKLSHPQYTYANDELRRKGKLVVGNNVEIKTHIFKWLHDSAVGGHSGRDATLHRIKSLFFWPKMSLEVQNYVRNCSVCQKNKYENVAKPGLLHPLPVPQGVWESISMDFIEGLPPSSGKHCILVVIDRLSKNAHFIALSHPYTAIEVAQAYLDNIFKLHGLPKDIVSDRDPTFLSEVWKELFRVHSVDLRYSTAYHPQTDGQTVVTNKTLETYLRCMTAEAPKT